MGFDKLQDLDADVCISIGGFNKKTQKENPKFAEGYYLGTRTVDKKNQKFSGGSDKLHFLQTPKGNLGVWGKTHLDKLMKQVVPGQLIQIEHTGMMPTPKGEMHRYEIGVDRKNVINVDIPAQDNDDASSGAEVSDADEYDSDDCAPDSDTAPADEVQPERPTPPARASAPDAARQARTQALLNKPRSKTV